MNASDERLLVPIPNRSDALANEKGQVALRAMQTADALAADLDVPSNTNQNLDLRQLHVMMRGRYRLAIILLLIGAVGGTVIGFKCGRKQYASTGMIEVKATLPKVLYSVDDKGMLPMFDSYVESQSAWLKSQEVINQALTDEKWQKVRPGTSDSAIEAFSKELTVTHVGQIIYVQVVDPDAGAAQTAVQTLISAYHKLYKSQDDASGEERIDFLQARVASLTKDLSVKRDRIRAIAEPYGTDDLRSLFQFRQEQVNKLDARIQEQTQLLTSLSAGTATSATRPSETPTVEELAATSFELQQLLQEGRAFDKQIAVYQVKKLGAENPTMLEAQSLRDWNERQVNDLVAHLIKERASKPKAVTPSGTVVTEDAVKAELGSLAQLRSKWEGDKLTVGKLMLEIERLRAEANEVQVDRDETQHRIDQLKVEETLNTRVVVLSAGDRPLSTYRNTQIPFSAAGGFGGGLLGFGLVACMALMDRRLRSPDQAGGARFNAPILGVLPRLPDDLLDPAHAAMAAHGVHEIRTVLQIRSRQSMHRAFAITSPHAGAGKTSLTLALGASYAAANLRTLLVDCDLVAGGLSRRLEAFIPRDFGEILVREGLVTAQQMLHVAKFVGSDPQGQGEMLVQWNVISSDQMKHAVDRTLKEPVGIVDAMHGMPLSRCVMETGISNLQILPVGSATARDVPLLSPEAIHSLMELLRREFDVVLVDTGPILGSLEASLVSGAADGVVLTVAKGDQRAMVERAVSQLVTVGARVAGMVFNGATIDELITYGSGSSTRYGGSSDRIISPDSVSTEVSSKLGPLASAVASSAPMHRGNSSFHSN